jgi:type IV pilus assembly protein PilA
MHSLRQRLNVRDESAFTLIELLVVLIIIGVLLAIAIPSYLGFQKSAQQTAAASDVRQAIPDAEAYYADYGNYDFTKNQDGSAAATPIAALQSYDSGLKVTDGSGSAGIVTVAGSADGASYCISAVDGTNYADVAGPGGSVQTKQTSDYCAGAWTAPTP